MLRRFCLIYALTALLFFLIALGYSLRVGPSFTSDALLIPKEQAGGSQISGLSAATKLLGLGGGGDQSSNFAKFQKYWGSRDVAETILKKHPGLYQELFGENWDKAHGRWYDHPHNLRQYAAVPFNWLFGVYPSYAPTAQDLADYIKASKPEQDQTGNEIQISFHAPNARFAQWFLSMVIAETDDAVRRAEQRRDQDFVDFARSRLEHENNVTYRDALTDSVRQFEIANMYSQAGDNFSFQYVEAPDLPINHSSPRPLLDAVLALIFGNLIATCVVAAMLLWPASRFSRTLDAGFDRLFAHGRPAFSRGRAGTQRPA